MALENDPNIKIEGSVRLVGESPSSITPQSSATANRSETSTSIVEITTTTASSRQGKQPTPREPQQVSPLFHTCPSIFFTTVYHCLSSHAHVTVAFSPGFVPVDTPVFFHNSKVVRSVCPYGVIVPSDGLTSLLGCSLSCVSWYRLHSHCNTVLDMVLEAEWIIHFIHPSQY